MSGAPSRRDSRYVVGIDLGTTNCALAYADTGAGEDGAISPLRLLPIPQVVSPGSVESRTLLPSFLYLATEEEAASGSFRVPWATDPTPVAHCAGVWARKRAAEMPDRVVSSAKSWLCHAAVDRTAPILPWLPAGAPSTGVPRISPLAASAVYLAHLRDAWNDAMAGDDAGARLEEQEVYLTVPASFDATARELTVRAASEAGLERVVLLEEPQAAVYAWVEAAGDGWRELVRVGDRILVCDVGGGTSDFSLVTVTEAGGALALERVAVGDHLLLGGDNMDLTLAFALRERLAASGTRLDAWQFRGLVQGCREAKEKLLSTDTLASVPLVVLGRGKRLIGGTVTVELQREEVERLLVDGFFPAVDLQARPGTSSGAGLGEIGLPFASDAAVTRHLAAFVSTHAEAGGDGAATGSSGLPTALLFNGGVMQARALRDRVGSTVDGWATAGGGPHVRVLDGADAEHAVARGAAYYGVARRGHGIRIRAGTARSYYVGVASSMPAVPGHPLPVKSLCVLPFGIEEGTRLEIPGPSFGLLVGERCVFRFFASSTRRDDTVGLVLDEWETEELDELAPLEVRLPAADSVVLDPSGRVPVRLNAHVTEIGTLEIWCHDASGDGQWKLELSVREGRAAA